MSSDFPPTIILAGGVATRLGAIAETTPKAMMPIAGTPFIDYQLRLLAEQHVDEVILSVAHLARQIEEFVGDGSRYGISIKYAYDGPKRLGTGGAILAALDTVPDNFGILYGDTYLDIEFAPVYKAFLKSGKKGLMTVLQNKNSWDKSNVLFENGEIKVYRKHNPTAEMQHIDYGLSILSKSCFSEFKPDETFDLSQVFERCIDLGDMAGFEVRKRFYEIGTPASLAETEQYLLDRAQSRN
ncbi:MAG: nucleotidyltransferase family protein [Cyanobacteria bacterium SZAS LIN-5]|nr:nucleotidyltransferase family protein [Cyanobacteria bacterium SZAS LIN-5]